MSCKRRLIQVHANSSSPPYFWDVLLCPGKLLWFTSLNTHLHSNNSLAAAMQGIRGGFVVRTDAVAAQGGPSRSVLTWSHTYGAMIAQRSCQVVLLQRWLHGRDSCEGGACMLCPPPALHWPPLHWPASQGMCLPLSPAWNTLRSCVQQEQHPLSHAGWFLDTPFWPLRCHMMLVLTPASTRTCTAMHMIVIASLNEGPTQDAPPT